MKSDLDDCISRLLEGTILPYSQVHPVCAQAIALFSEEPNMLSLASPIHVCGDTHGHYQDLLEVFRNYGAVPSVRYLFLGDYVDRGYFSIETIELLLCLKIRYPDRIFLLRGNHESEQITAVYGFYDQVQKAYGDLAVFRWFIEAFQYLPLAAVVDGEVFCVHAGLSPELERTGQINAIARPCEIPPSGALCDLMWSDPEEIQGWAVVPKGAGYMFGADVVARFHHVNGTRLLCRSHQLAMEGYKYSFENRLVTIFTAPNYCYRCENKGAIMILGGEGKVEEFRTYVTIYDKEKEKKLKQEKEECKKTL